MKKTVSLAEFAEEFRAYGREDNFTPEGLAALYNYLLELEEELGEEIELDVIDLCCNYNEYTSLEEFREDYSGVNVETLEDLRNYTEVIPVGKEGLIIRAF